MLGANRCVIYARKSRTPRTSRCFHSCAAAGTPRVAVRRSLVVEHEYTEACSAERAGTPDLWQSLARGGEGSRHHDPLLATRPAREKPCRWRRSHLRTRSSQHRADAHAGGHVRRNRRRQVNCLASIRQPRRKMIDDLSAGVKRGNRSLHERGRVAAQVPIGYYRAREGNALRGAGRAVRDPERFHLVRDMFARSSTVPKRRRCWRAGVGRGPHLERQQAAGIWSGTSEHVHAILRNPFYAGLPRAERRNLSG